MEQKFKVLMEIIVDYDLQPYQQRPYTRLGVEQKKGKAVLFTDKGLLCDSSILKFEVMEEK